MKQAAQWWWVGMVIAILFVVAGSNPAQDKDKKPDGDKKVEVKDKKADDKGKKKGDDKDKKKPYEKHDTTALYNSLRDVINTGAKMFNDQGDHAGCYRLYQGSLLSVRPFLAPELQKRIDTGLAGAEKLPGFAERAFELRKILDDVRNQVKPAEKKDDKQADKKDEKKDDKKAGDKKGDKKDDKKAGDKKDDKNADKKADDKKSADKGGDKGQVAGKLTFQNKAIAGGYFVTLIAADGKKFSSAIQKDGSFQFKTAISAGEYKVAIEPIPGESAKGAVTLPPRYASDAGSGLVIRVAAGKQQVDLNLVK